MGAAGFSGTLVLICQPTWCHVFEGLLTSPPKSLKFHFQYFVFISTEVYTGHIWKSAKLNRVWALEWCL